MTVKPIFKMLSAALAGSLFLTSCETHNYYGEKTAELAMKPATVPKAANNDAKINQIMKMKQEGLITEQEGLITEQEAMKMISRIVKPEVQQVPVQAPTPVKPVPTPVKAAPKTATAGNLNLPDYTPSSKDYSNFTFNWFRFNGQNDATLGS